MIEVLVDTNAVTIEGVVYQGLEHPDHLVEALSDLLERACYSGETISLWKSVPHTDMKEIVGEYYCRR